MKTRLEWWTVHDVASSAGVSPNAVRWAIRRCMQRQHGYCWNGSWTVYAEKHGREWRVPVLVEYETAIAPDNHIHDHIVRAQTFHSRTAFLKFLERGLDK